MYRINRKLTVLVMVSMMLPSLFSCSMDEDRMSDTVDVSGREFSSAGLEEGTVIVKLTEDMIGRLGLYDNGSVRLGSCGVKSVDDAFSSLGVTSMQRVFTYDPETEERIRARGMHLYYEVRFDEDQPLTKAMDAFTSIQGVAKVEYSPKIVRGDHYTITPVSDPAPARSNAATEILNDPRLSNQWHYYNDGSMTNTIAGADINILPAWQKGLFGRSTTEDGKEVIVAVVDGGVDYTHQDLADNMWTSSDGRHGYNFVAGTSNVTADDHGTHVAGTVAAVNNNGIGVAGVAGGNFAEGIPGVRIMSCQIFEGEDGCTTSALAEAIRWGADRGAVISQNSWGFDKDAILNGSLTDTPEVLKAAIDYFIEVAGTDGNGNQTGPMKGGLVVFAAGNDEMDRAYPPSYESVLSVSAISGDYQPAYYTNYGDWVDVCAPGGDFYNGTEVLSTLPGDSYGLMQGTSMACPHVSGMAALLVSEFGGPGFTADQLRNMIESTVRDMSQYMSPLYSGLGLVDVGASLNALSDIAPDPVTDFTTEVKANIIYFSFSVPSDEDNIVPSTAKVYYSTSEFDITDSLAVEELPSLSMTLGNVSVGDKVSGSVTGLEFETDYWVSVAVSDVARNRSALVEPVHLRTLTNNAPYFEPAEDIDMTVKQPNVVTLDLVVKDDDGHTLTPSVQANGVAVSMVEDTLLRVTISSQSLGVGSHDIAVSVTDGYDEAVRNIHITVNENNAPVNTLAIEDNVLNVGDVLELDLQQYFSDPDGDNLIYRVQFSLAGIVSSSVSGTTLRLTAESQGQTTVTVSALDDMSMSASCSFNLLVRDAGRPADFFPNPVVDVLNIRAGEVASDARIEVRSASGALVIAQDEPVMEPFAPAVVDMSALAGGMYSVKLTYTAEDGTSKSITTDIAKL